MEGRGRLYIQSLGALLLVCAAWLLQAFPVAPLEPVNDALHWALKTDYDWGALLARAQSWVEETGEWRDALAGLREEASPDTPLMPVDGSLLWEFGWLPPGVSEEFHEGIDLLAPAGTPVVAILDGTVIAVRQDRRHGLVVEVQHDEIVALYGQLEGVVARAGDEVRRGQIIGRVSRAAGVEQNLPPHLHFEVWPTATGAPVDPVSYLDLGGKLR